MNDPEPESATTPAGADADEPWYSPFSEIGGLAAVSHAAAYRWATQIAAGRDLLDAGCGEGAGTAVLAAAGARSATGVDSSGELVRIAQLEHGDATGFLAGELEALPFADAAFDLVACFELDLLALDPEGALDQLQRVLAPGGVLLVSWDPHGESGGFEGRLRRRFQRVTTYAQRHCVGSLVDEAAEVESNGAGARPDASWLDSSAGPSRGVLAAAGDGELPAMQPAASLAGSGELERYDRALAAWEQRARHAEAEVAAIWWKVAVAREARKRVSDRLNELENQPLRRLGRVLRGKPGRIVVRDSRPDRERRAKGPPTGAQAPPPKPPGDELPPAG